METFINIPLSISRRTDLSQTEKMIYGFVKGFDVQNLVCYASNGYIAETIGLKPLAVSRAIKGLIEKKLLISRNSKGIKRSISTKIKNLIPEDTNLIAEDKGSISSEINNNIVDNKVNNKVKILTIGDWKGTEEEWDSLSPGLKRIYKA